MIGSKATVTIRSEKSLEAVAQILEEALSAPRFRFDSACDPPHSVTAMTECLGFEIWLWDAKAEAHREYFLVVETSMDIRDRFDGQIADISEWLSKHISIVTDLDCAPSKNEN